MGGGGGGVRGVGVGGGCLTSSVTSMGVLAAGASASARASCVSMEVDSELADAAGLTGGSAAVAAAAADAASCT